MTKLQYKDEFLDTGITFITQHGAKQQFVICGEDLRNESLKQNKQKRYLNVKHRTFNGKEQSFERKKQVKWQKLDTRLCESIELHIHNMLNDIKKASDCGWKN